MKKREKFLFLFFIALVAFAFGTGKVKAKSSLIFKCVESQSNPKNYITCTITLQVTDSPTTYNSFPVEFKLTNLTLNDSDINPNVRG